MNYGVILHSFFYLIESSFVLYSNQLTYIEYEASNIYTASVFQTRVKERYWYFHSFHYISA